MSTILVAFFAVLFLQSDFGVVADRGACRKQRTSTGRSNRFPGLIGRSSRLLKHTRDSFPANFWGTLVDGHLRCRFAHHPWSVHNVPELRSLGGVNHQHKQGGIIVKKTIVTLACALIAPLTFAQTSPTA